MNKVDIKVILQKNPQVDKEAVKQTREIVRDLRAKNVKCPFPSAQPPYNPYSSLGNPRRCSNPSFTIKSTCK